ncbi:MAG TPA: ATP-binding cassette domain-containing protein [Spirochaetia bacterium]|nr:ATP-binding cassette domain-containing protein [Spirochaetia bacterium]
MISIQNLSKYYDTTRAVENISFDIRKGEILGLLGPNGAGKTTTLRILTCYLKPTSGTVRIKDLDIIQKPLEVKRLIGYLPESAPLYPDMLVFDYLHYIASIRGLRGQARLGRINELATLCGIREVMHRSIGELSKGYKQRVGLAHSMMGDPEILVLDEPTSGLDPNQIAEIRSIIREIGREKTVILSTHILSEAEATCDRIVIINQGQIVADGAPETLRSSAGDDTVIRISLKGVEPGEVESHLTPLPGVIRISTASSGELPIAGQEQTVRVFCERDMREEIYRRIRETDWSIMEFLLEKKSLEHIFRELTL